MDERWFTVEQIATTLRVHEQTVRRWLRTHVLAGRYFGGRTGWRVRQTELDAFLARDQHGQRARAEARP